MGMRPADFWALSPGEWRALLAHEGFGEAGALTRDGLCALFAQYPDQTP